MGRLSRLTRLSAWKPRVRERALLAAMISGPLALLVSLMAVALAVAVVSSMPRPVNTYTAIADAARAQNYARSALLLWLSGTAKSEKPLLARNAAEQSVNLSDAGFEVFSIDPVSIDRRQGTDAAEWTVTLAATLVVPGSGVSQVNTFVVPLLERGGDYQLLAWPRITSTPGHPFTVASRYTVPVERTGPLGQAAQRFVTAYLTSTGSGGSLGQFVSAQFSGGPLADSPYSSVEVESIKALAGDPQPSSAKPGTQVSVLVRVKASASAGTWSIMDLPLRMSLGTNKVWLVDGFDDALRWGRISGG